MELKSNDIDEKAEVSIAATVSIRIDLNLYGQRASDPWGNGN